MTDTGRRAEWTSAATDYALEHGLIGLSLRPLAAELGTSDRMLLYHFGSKDELVAAVLRHASDRSSATIDAMPPSRDLRAAVLDLWDALGSSMLGACGRLYVEAAALGLLGSEPYATIVRESNARWTAALVGHLVRSGVQRPFARRAAAVVDAAFMGFQLDEPLEDARTQRRAVTDLADALVALTTATARAR
jgi:AcrR family transcriptional regulator